MREERRLSISCIESKHDVIEFVAKKYPHVDTPTMSGLLAGFSHSISIVVCFKYKQTLEVFSESYNKASSLFDLIHCDSWGPYTVP